MGLGLGADVVQCMCWDQEREAIMDLVGWRYIAFEVIAFDHSAGVCLCLSSLLCYLFLSTINAHRFFTSLVSLYMSD